jgi:AraC-like DNA-binding protein
MFNKGKHGCDMQQIYNNSLSLKNILLNIHSHIEAFMPAQTVLTPVEEIPSKRGMITSINQKPRPILEPYIHNAFICSFHYQACPSNFESIKDIPDGSARIVLIKEGFGTTGKSKRLRLVFYGPRSDLREMDPSAADWDEVVGVNIKPGALKILTGVSSDDLKDSLVPSELLWGSQARDILDQLAHVSNSREQLSLLESRLAQKVKENREKDQFVLEAAKCIEKDKGKGTLKDFMSQTGYSRSQVFRKFEECMGLSPKRFAQVVRFKNIFMEIASLMKPDWARLASEYGYYDQAHLAHDFHKMTGLYPESFHQDFQERGSFIPGEVKKQVLLYCSA